MRSNAVRLLALASVLTAACDGDGGPGPDRLTPGEVAGVYAVCTLRFQPSQTVLPAADIRANVIATPAPAGKPEPSLTLSPSTDEYELVYTRKSDSFLQQQRGSVGFGQQDVFVRLYNGNDASQIARETLLPPTLSLRFEESPRRLSVSPGSFAYQVRRADYARAAGISEEGLQDQINGTLTATFQAGGCG